jgi:hypothetical protein
MKGGAVAGVAALHQYMSAPNFENPTEGKAERLQQCGFGPGDGIVALANDESHATGDGRSQAA